jgi:hypothetical protein
VQIAPQNLPQSFKAIAELKQLEEIAKKRKQWPKIIIDKQRLTCSVNAAYYYYILTRKKFLFVL